MHRYLYKYLNLKQILICVILLFLICHEAIAQCNPKITRQYTNSFTNRVGSEWTVSKGSIPWRTGYVGPFGPEYLNVQIDDLDCHDSLRISCIIQISRTWDGNGNFCCGPDIFIFIADNDTIFQTTFTLTESFGNFQSYPSPYYPPPNTINNKQGTGAISGDNEYKIEFNFKHTNDSVKVSIVQPASQGVNDEAWILKEFSLSTVKCPPTKFDGMKKVLNLCANEDSVNVYEKIDSSIHFSPIASVVDSNGWIHPKPSNIGEYSFPFTYGDNGCLYNDTFAIIIDSIPFVRIDKVEPICAGHDSIVLNLFPKGGRLSPLTYLDSMGVVRTSTLKQGVYPIFYAVTDSNGCTSSDSLSLKINPIPDASISQPEPTCENSETLLLQAALNRGGTFFGGNFIDSVGYFYPHVALSGKHRIFYKYVDSNNCSNVDSSVVQVDTVPDASIVSTGPYCENIGIINLMAKVNFGGRYFGGGFIDSAGHFDPSIAKAGIHKVFYQFTDGNGCINKDSTHILIDSIPSAAITSAGPFCENKGRQVLSAEVNSGGRFFGGNFIDSAGNFDPTLASSGTHKVFYHFTDGNGCSNFDSTYILVYGIPSATIVPAGPFCENSGSQLLIAAVNSGGNFTGGNFIDDLGNFTPSIAGPGVHRIYYQFIDSNSCENTDSIDVEVYLKPDATIRPAGPLCLNQDALQLEVAESGGTFSGGSYVDANGLFRTSDADTGLNQVIYTINNAQNCSESDTILIRMYPMPDSNWNINPAGGCEPLHVNLNSSSPDEIRWFIAEQLDTRNKIESLQLSKGDYSLEISFSNTFGCSLTKDSLIRVFEKPLAAFRFEPGKIFSSQTEVSFIDQSSGTISSWQWSFGDGNFTDQQSPYHKYLQSGSYQVILIVNPSDLCSDTAMMPIEVNANFMVHIPNAISPNHDGLNDIFQVVGEGIDRISLKIFNRWGEKIYQSENFSSWDATYQGVEVPPGVYIYKITFYDLKGMKHYRNGYLNVIR